jgi:hypothetical protein
MIRVAQSTSYLHVGQISLLRVLHKLRVVLSSLFLYSVNSTCHNLYLHHTYEVDSIVSQEQWMKVPKRKKIRSI